MTDWFRRKTWTEKDKEEFFAKLGRARKESRAQYLKIQALELIETEDEELLNVAEALLNKVQIEYPENRIERSPVLNALGNIYKLRKKYDRAIDYYKQSLEYESVFPNMITTSYLDFSELVVKMDKKELFDFTENLLESRLEGQIFPIAKYKMYSVLSIINQNKKNVDKAKYYSKMADQNANSETSGLRYHKHLGLVKERDSLLDRLKKRE